MSVRICVLASGSKGNATLVSSGSAAVLIDAGISARRIREALEELGLAIGDLAGICLSHEHSDHVAGLVQLHRKHGVPVYANRGTAEALSRDPKYREFAWRIFTNGAAFELAGLQIEPFSVPHDAYDPVGFRIQNDRVVAGVVTDLGMATTLVKQRLRDCHALVLESNHDEWMLQQSARPWSLKQRILGRQGHLSNQHACDLIREVGGAQLQHVFLAHLSDDCNEPAVALHGMKKTLESVGLSGVEVSLTYPHRLSRVWEFQDSRVG